MPAIVVPDQDYVVVDKFARYVRADRLRYDGRAAELQGDLRNLGVIVIRRLVPAPRPAIHEPAEASS